MILKPNFELVDIAGEHVVVPVGDEANSFNGVVAISEAAYFLLKNLNEPKSKTELISMLIQEYDVDISTADADVEAMTKNLLEMGVIEE